MPEESKAHLSRGIRLIMAAYTLTKSEKSVERQINQMHKDFTFRYKRRNKNKSK